MKKNNKNKIKKSRLKGKLIKFAATLFIISIVTLILVCTNKNISSADVTGDGVTLNKYYKTITIQNGDTLWDLANTYKAGSYQTVFFRLQIL